MTQGVAGDAEVTASCILELARSREFITSRIVARALGMHEHYVQHRLALLTRDGDLERLPVKGPLGYRYVIGRAWR